MSPRVGEPGDDFITLANELFDVIVKIGKCGADFAYVPFELFDAMQGSADRAAEDNVRRDEFCESRRAPRIPELGVISANQKFVVRHGKNPFAQVVFSGRRAQRPIWVWVRTEPGTSPTNQSDTRNTPRPPAS